MSTISDLIDEFFDPLKPSIPIDVSNLPHALEDLPADVQTEATTLLSTPAGIAFQQRVFDVLENTVAMAYGGAEDLFKFLSQYSVTAYTYAISSLISRGERPDQGKITTLYNQGIRATINLCEETPDGDTSYIAQAGLTGKMETYHFGIVDGTPPTVDQVVSLLNLLADLQRRGIRSYIHCEAGKGRTGVMVACIRMATMGWSAKDAVTEAKNFGLWTPDQEAFIENFGNLLIAQPPLPVLSGYPILRPGSVTPTHEQLTRTLQAAANATQKGLQ